MNIINKMKHPNLETLILSSDILGVKLYNDNNKNFTFTDDEWKQQFKEFLPMITYNNIYILDKNQVWKEFLP
jgi:hypothetical protein